MPCLWQRPAGAVWGPQAVAVFVTLGTGTGSGRSPRELSGAVHSRQRRAAGPTSCRGSLVCTDGVRVRLEMTSCWS